METLMHDNIHKDIGKYRNRIAELEAENKRLVDQLERTQQRYPYVLLDERNKLADALVKIEHWPDGGNNYGQRNIKRFANEVLSSLSGLSIGKE